MARAIRRDFSGLLISAYPSSLCQGAMIFQAASRRYFRVSVHAVSTLRFGRFIGFAKKFIEFFINSRRTTPFHLSGRIVAFLRRRSNDAERVSPCWVLYWASGSAAKGAGSATISFGVLSDSRADTPVRPYGKGSLRPAGENLSSDIFCSSFRRLRVLLAMG